MKNILALFSFFTWFGANAQLFHASLTSQGWAAGMCCQSGVNYTLTITGNAAELEKLVVEGICIDGMYLSTQRSLPVVTSVNKTPMRSFTFEFSTSRYGGFQETASQPTCSDTGKIYLKGKEFLMIGSHKRLMYLAYP